MNGPTEERKTRAAMQFLAWAQDWAPEWHAKIVETVGEAPPASPLAQLGEVFGHKYAGFSYGEAPGTQIMDLHGEKPGLVIPSTYGLGQAEGPPAPAPEPSWADKLFSFAEKAIPAYFAYETQKDVSKINVERAKQGMPPVDPGVVAPQVKVVHDVSAPMQREIQQMKLGGVNLLLWGGLALGAFFLIRAMR